MKTSHRFTRHFHISSIIITTNDVRFQDVLNGILSSVTRFGYFEKI